MATPAHRYPRHISANTMAMVLGITPRLLMRWRALGKGPPSVRRGGRVLYETSKALAWIRAKRWARPAHPVEDDAQVALSPREKLALLTPRQLEVHRFICERFRRLGKAPTRQEIMGAFGFRSPTAAQDIVNYLVKKQVLARRTGAARGLTPIVFPRGV